MSYFEHVSEAMIHKRHNEHERTCRGGGEQILTCEHKVAILLCCSKCGEILFLCIKPGDSCECADKLLHHDGEGVNWDGFTETAPPWESN